MSIQSMSIIAVLICFLLPFRAAFRHTHGSPMLFRAHALFALSWAILLPYYQIPSSDRTAPLDLLAGFAGYLNAMSGLLLLREAEDRRAHNKSLARSLDDLQVTSLNAMSLDRQSLALLGLAMFPGGLRVLGVSLDTIFNGIISEVAVTTLIGSVLTAIGYYYFYVGIDAFATTTKAPIRRVFVEAVGVVLALYAIADVSFTVLMIINTSLEMPTAFSYAFMILKLLLTALYLLVVIGTDTPPERRNGIRVFEVVLGLLNVLSFAPPPEPKSEE